MATETKSWIIPNGPAEGKVLDRWGFYLRLKRRDGEEDFIYRKRLQTIILRRGMNVMEYQKNQLDKFINMPNEMLEKEI